MFERHIEKPAPQRRHGLIEPRIDSRAGDLARFFVRGVALRLVSEHVSGELIEQQHQGQGALGGVRHGV